MKNLLLIVVLFSLLSCSDDGENSLTPDPMDGLSIVQEFSDCIELNECYINYRLKNETEFEKHFFIKFTFEDSDSHYDSAEYIRETIADPQESSIVQILIDEGNAVESLEIVDVEIME